MRNLLRSTVLAVLCWVAHSSAQELPRMVVYNVRALGMGGAAVAVAGEDNVFFFNPALLTTLRYPRFNLVDLNLRLNTNALAQYHFYQDHRDQLSNINRLSAEELNNLYREALSATQQQAFVGVEGPLPHVLSRRVGLGLFSGGQVRYEIFEGAIGIPLVDVRLQGDMQVMALLAHTFSAGPRGRAGDISIGISGKYLKRWVTRKTKNISGFSNNENLHFYRGQSIGVDVGAFYTLNRRLHFGATIYDLFATPFKWNVKGATLDNPVPPDKISPSYRLGMVYRPGIKFKKLFYNLTLALDFDEPFTGDDTFFKTVHLGSEAQLTPLLAVRAGFNQGYPTLGLGLNLYVIRADYAFYGEEMGKFAGQTAAWNHAVHVQVGF